jgi:hypothetical protein
MEFERGMTQQMGKVPEPFTVLRTKRFPAVAYGPIFAFFAEIPFAHNGRLAHGRPYPANWIDRSTSHSASEFLQAVRAESLERRDSIDRTTGANPSTNSCCAVIFHAFE